MEQAQAWREFIRVKGAPTDEMLVWVTRHGPVIFSEGSHYYSLRWSMAEPNSFQFPFLDIDRAANWTEFTAALARFPGPGQNFVYADVDGNIGYRATGRLPIRGNFDGTVPVDGSSGQFEWQGFIPFDQLPAVFNPAHGRIVTANQNPFPKDYAYQVSGAFAAEYRSNQIRDLLTAHEHWKPENMLTVEKDVLLGLRALSREAGGSGVRPQAPRRLTSMPRLSRCCATGMAKWKFRSPRRCSFGWSTNVSATLSRAAPRPADGSFIVTSSRRR